MKLAAHAYIKIFRAPFAGYVNSAVILRKLGRAASKALARRFKADRSIKQPSAHGFAELNALIKIIFNLLGQTVFSDFNIAPEYLDFFIINYGRHIRRNGL